MTTEPSTNPSRRSRDLGFAIAVLLLAVAIAGVLFYGNWWRQNRLHEVYETRLKTSMQEYQQIVANENPDPDQVYVLGAEIDVIMRRISDQLSEPEVAWKNFEFLREHTHRLDSLFSTTPNWQEPTLLSVKLGEIKRRISAYENRCVNILAKLAESESSFGDLAKLQQVEDAIVNGGFAQNSADSKAENAYLTQVLKVLKHCKSKSHSVVHKPTEAETTQTERTKEVVLSRATAIAAWLVGHQDQVQKLNELEAVLSEVREDSDSPNGPLRMDDNRTEALLAISQLMISRSGDGEQGPINDALKRFDRSYRYDAKVENGVLGQAMAIRFQAVSADWAGISRKIGELSQSLTVGRREVSFMRRDASAAILQLLGSKPWLDRMDTQLQIEKGLETAVNLSRYAPDTLRMLMKIGVARNTAAENPLQLKKFPSIDARVVESAKASPSSIIAMTTEAIAAAINQNDQQLKGVIDSEAMLNVGLNDMLSSIAIWRSSTNPAPDLAESKVWITLMKSIIGLPNTDRQGKNGNALLALATWQSHAGDHESASNALESARPFAGDSQLYIQVEDLVNQSLPKELSP